MDLSLITRMGCTASVNLPASLDDKPLSDPSTMEDNTSLKCDSSNKIFYKNKQIKNSRDIHINHHTQIVLVSPDNHEGNDTSRTTDSESIMPIFNNNEQTKATKARSLISESQSTTPSSHSSKSILPGQLKGVLKTGRDDTKSRNILTNHPIKTVTFLDTVTVLSVY